MQKFIPVYVLSFLLCASLIPHQALAQERPSNVDEGRARIVGTVLDQSTGRPIAGAVIIVSDREGNELATLTSDTQGEFSGGGLPEGIVEVFVDADGYRAANNPSFRLISGKTATAEFVLNDELGATNDIVVIGRPIATSRNGSIGQVSLGREEIRRAPGTGGDVFRGLSTLPGVVSTGEFSNFSVRGRGPRDNLILIDGIPFDRAVHFDQSLGESGELGGGGRFSIFAQNVIDQADFQPGGWEAAFGGSNGSLLNLKLAEGNRETPFTSIRFDLAGAELLYDGPSQFDDDTSLLVSARYFNFGPLFDLIDERDIGTPQFADLIIKSSTELNPDTNLSLLAIYTPEWFTRDASNVIESPDFEDVILLETRQHSGLFGATLENFLGDDGRLTNTVFFRYSDDTSEQGEAVPELSTDLTNADTFFVEDGIISLQEREIEFGWRGDYSQSNRFGQFSIGGRLSLLQTDYEQNLSRPFNVFEFDQDDIRPDPSQNFITLLPEEFDFVLDESIVRGAAYVDQEFRFGSFSIKPGVRLEYDGLLDVTTISPRLQASAELTSNTRLSATAGLYYQPPRILEIAADINNSELQHERTFQASVGLEHFVGRNLRVLVEGYYQDLSNLVTGPDRATGVFANSGDGRTYGVDALVSKRFANRWSATARYSYSNSRRDDNDGLGSYVSDFNTPHIANFTVNFEPSDNWAFALQYQISSGKPVDSFRIFEDVLGPGNLPRFSRESIARNAERLKPFQSLNARIDYRQKIGSANLIAFLDVINVLGRVNESNVEFSPVAGRSIPDGLDLFPQIGVTIEF